MIDLHVHSTFSDGSYSPEVLVEMASEAGLTGMALTDHDCTSGIERFLEACRAADLVGVPGVEISATVDKGTMHMLGYHVARGHAGLEGALQHIRNGRELRNKDILKKINALGLALSWEEVVKFSGEEVVGRPHFAQAMVARGYVKNNKEAFDKYLAKSKPAYADRFRLPPMESIRAIRDAGGVAVLSHPFTLGLDREGLRAAVAELVDDGLQGIEVYYSEHSSKLVKQYLDLVAEFDLVATGGSDFHGAINPDVKLGTGFGPLRVPDDILQKLEERRTTV